MKQKMSWPFSKMLFFDLEVGCSQELYNVLSVEGPVDIWAHWPFGISVGASQIPGQPPKVWYDVDARGGPAQEWGNFFLIDFCQYLEEKAREGYKIFTWNGTGFDWRLLGALLGDPEWAAQMALDSYDPTFQVLCQRGYPVGLESAASIFGYHKNLDGGGASVPLLWAQGFFDKVIQYVDNDVTMLRLVIEDIISRSGLRWQPRAGGVSFCHFPTFFTAGQCLQFPRPDTSWLDKPITREETVAWMQE